MRNASAGLILLLLASGCTKRVPLEVPQARRAAHTASLEELFELINQRYAQIQNLTVVRSRIEFQSEFEQEGYLKVYPGARAQLVARPPDAIYLNILNPLTNSTVITMAAQNHRFQIWVPRENKYLVGESDVKIEDENPMYHVRPDHILQAVMIEPLPQPGDVQIPFVEESEDAGRSYYVISIIQPVAGQVAACLQRKLWIDRSVLQLSRQVYYDCGRPVSRIDYGEAFEIGQKLVSSEIELNRVADHYRLRIQVESDAVRLDRELRADTFTVPQPPGAELVKIKGAAAGGSAQPDQIGGNR